jgi:acyl-[acyl-carrier-protein]-phospholipid O-acyltransferase/long-chain-fatty-acid--[acyl-carrier-protein] ligase
VSRGLMTSRRFAPLFWCQFFSALNDNFVKNALVALILFGIASQQQAGLVALAGAALVLPMFLFSAMGGEIADSHDKALIARRLKFAEIFVALLGAIGFWLSSVAILMATLALLGLIAALFGPIKYGILPDHLEKQQLPAANALVESGTFFAILLGTVAGTALGAMPEKGWAAGAMVACAIAAWLSARTMPSTHVSAPDLTVDRNPLRSTVRLLAELRQHPRLWTGTLIVSWFWLDGMVVLSAMPPFLTQRFNATPGMVSAALMTFAIGIAVGSWVAARASRLRTNLGLVPFAALLIGVFALDLAWVTARWQAPASLDPWAALASVYGVRFFIGLFGLAMAGGMFVVPSFAAVQAWSPPALRARVVAASGVLAAVFMAVGALVTAVLPAFGFSTGALLTLLGLANLAAAVLILRYWGMESLRDFATLLFSIFYRVEVRGRENMPQAGERMIITPNHVSLLDGPLMHAFLPIDAVFAIDTGMAQKSWIKPLLHGVPFHPIDPLKPMSARELTRAVKAGEPLVIFPEGRITVTGHLMKIYDGTAMIADKADALVAPVRIEGAERSSLSYLKQGQIKKALFPRIRITIEKPGKLALPEGLTGRQRRRAAGAALQDVMMVAAVKTAMGERTLFEALSDAMAVRDTGGPIIEDPLGSKLSYRRLIAAAQVLGKKLLPVAKPGEAVGVLLPNTTGVVAVFFALQGIGRVPAMLNYSAGPANVAAACRAAVVSTVLSSRAFVEKGKLEPIVEALNAAGVRIVWLEDVRPTVSALDRIAGLLRGSNPRVPRKADDPAVILFTSGSEGTPKGVVLSHRNILANAAQCLSQVDVNGQDKLFNALPLFHSFGLTAGLVMPLMAGVKTFLYPSPLHYRIIPELIYQTNATVLFGTDTFLSGYGRAAHPYDFRSLRLVVAGAEAVKASTRDTWFSSFGIRILEGYGVTECSPVISLNTPIAFRVGTVGRLVPLLEGRLDPVPGIEDGGRLSVKGPNVMLGYMRAEAPGVLEPPPEGWHDTGDIVTIDAQGFVAIRGRAKRFAKVAGEMISLAAVEALALKAWPDAQHAVVAVPDPRKGQRLVLVTSAEDPRREIMLKEARASGFGELVVPQTVVPVKKLPLLGSGKTDYPAVQKLAEAATAPKAAQPAA